MRSRKLLFVLSLIALTVASSFARNILEKKMFYLSGAAKPGQARFWVVYLGNFDVKLNRNVPGEGTVSVDASVNLQLLSSGYIEGNGYGTKGKIDCLPAMLLTGEGKEDKRIVIDSIDYIYDYGTKVRLLTGETGDLAIDIEGTKVTAKKFLMREYKLTTLYGEEILKEGSTETPIQGISLTPEGAVRAQKAQAAVSASQK